MPIKTQELYYMSCGACGRSCGPKEYFPTPQSAHKNAIERGWVKEKLDYICPRCIYTRYLKLEYKVEERESHES